MVWWNSHEVGRTQIAAKTNNPKWDPATSQFEILYDVALDFRQFVLEFEVIDANIQKHRPDFMGCVSFTGDALIKFLVGENTSFPMEKSTKFDAAGNKLVAGKLQISATAPTIIEQFPDIVEEVNQAKAKMLQAKSKKESSKDRDSPLKVGALLSKITPLSSMGGWLSKSKKKTTAEEESVKAEALLQAEAAAAEAAAATAAAAKEEGSIEASDMESEVESTIASVFEDVEEKDAVLYFNVMCAEHLPAGKLIVLFNGIDAGEVSVPDCSTTASILGAHLKLPIPQYNSISDCSITIELWDESLTFFWGEIDMRGTSFVQLVTNRMSETTWLAFDSTRVPKRVNGSKAARKIVNGRLCVGGCVLVGPVGDPRTYNVDICSATNLLEVSDTDSNNRFACFIFSFLLVLSGFT